MRPAQRGIKFLAMTYIAFQSYRPMPCRAASFQQYQPDLAPIQTIPIQERPTLGLSAPSNTSRQVLTRADYQKRLSYFEGLHRNNQNWPDGYWMVASQAFQLATSYTDERDHHKALSLYDRGQQISQSCLKRWPTQILCQMFYASNLAGASAIRGIFSSIKHAATVRKIWTHVIASKLNYQFTPEVSLQGSAHYALGLFYRLVPDSTVIDWVFGVRGNLKASIAMHQQAIAIDGPSPCNLLMLAVAKLCASQQGDEKLNRVEIMAELLQSQQKKPTDLNQRLCVAGARKIKQHPELACGYTTAKQQIKEQDPESGSRDSKS